MLVATSLRRSVLAAIAIMTILGTAGAPAGGRHGRQPRPRAGAPRPCPRPAPTTRPGADELGSTAKGLRPHRQGDADLFHGLRRAEHGRCPRRYHQEPRLYRADIPWWPSQVLASP